MREKDNFQVSDENGMIRSGVKLAQCEDSDVKIQCKRPSTVFLLFSSLVKDLAKMIKPIYSHAIAPETLPDFSLTAEPSKFAEKIKQLPPLSETILRAMAIANDENYRFQEFNDVIKRDGAITTLMLKISNSVVFGGGGKQVETVEQAVVRLGMKQCNRLIAAIGMKGALRSKNPEVANRVDILWRHSLLTASVATNLNIAMGLGFGGIEFTASILHDIGRIVMLLADDKLAKSVDPLTFREKPDILEREQARMGTDHCHIGEQYGIHNKLPLPILEAIRYHHTPLGASEENIPLVDLIAASDHLTNHALSERKVSNYDYKSCPSFVRMLEQIPHLQDVNFMDYISEVMKLSTRETRDALRVS